MITSIARPSMRCLSDELVMELVHGHLDDEQLVAIEQHLLACADCRTLVAETAEADRTRPNRDDGPRAREGAPLSRDTRVGRYEVEDLIGAGGMGFVYAARDPELQRRVALKVMRSTAMLAGGDIGARMLREARAMAQLSHPNVVTVYDVGTYDDRVFLAMELVAGTTLRRWLDPGERTLAEILDVFRAAGEGLSAAHRIGLVHRDFKPENVLVGTDGRVRVTDFGLARPVDREATGSHAAIASPNASQTWGHTTLTRTGVFAGTPAYMAPEQFAGKAPDPRSDQFAFCVALHEAIYGERPFSGTTSDEIVAAIIAGQVRPPSKARAVPPALREVIVRGLSRMPETRYPSIADLLASLASAVATPSPAAPARRRRRLLWAALAGATLAAAAAITIRELRISDSSAPVAMPTVAPALAMPGMTPAASRPRVPAPTASPEAGPSSVAMTSEESTPTSSDAARVTRKTEKPPHRNGSGRNHVAKRPLPPPPQPSPPPAAPIRVGDGLRDPFGAEKADDAK